MAISGIHFIDKYVQITVSHLPPAIVFAFLTGNNIPVISFSDSSIPIPSPNFSAHEGTLPNPDLFSFILFSLVSRNFFIFFRVPIMAPPPVTRLKPLSYPELGKCDPSGSVTFTLPFHSPLSPCIRSLKPLHGWDKLERE